ncbi:hypothetical protein QBC38DRAFT_362081 [Podospora fimiseda]|uniref:Peptidyl-tRNA hydrolase n=1 Tax=Podospora fimiseda TaxID=252190 RepID=A0AAN7H5H5_9PEZI|nr:hypothetical protein QBC38DRAFT_362081 [Podospora fimiseda]
MRLSSATMLALPLLAAAAEGPFEQYKAKFQNFLGSFGAKAPIAETNQVPIVNTGKKPKKVTEPKKVETLTLAGWNDSLFTSIKPESTKPEEWLVLISGRNNTCFGHCDKVEAAWKDASFKFAQLPSSPNLGYINCDDEPVLCNSWSASTGVFWAIDVLPPPAQTDILVKRLNLTTVTGQDIVDAYATRSADTWRKIDNDGWFHPIHGKFATWGVAVPLGYFFWALNVIPSWVMMVGVSFLSRSMM